MEAVTKAFRNSSCFDILFDIILKKIGKIPHDGVTYCGCQRNVAKIFKTFYFRTLSKTIIELCCDYS